MLDVLVLNLFKLKCAGLALWALESSKLRYPVRPKMHSFEHLTLGPSIGIFFLGCVFYNTVLYGFETRYAWIQQHLMKTFDGPEDPRLLLPEGQC